MVMEGKPRSGLSRMHRRVHAKSHRTRCVDKRKSTDHDSGHKILGHEPSPPSRPPRHRCQSDISKTKTYGPPPIIRGVSRTNPTLNRLLNLEVGWKSENPYRIAKFRFRAEFSHPEFVTFVFGCTIFHL